MIAVQTMNGDQVSLDFGDAPEFVRYIRQNNSSSETDTDARVSH